jgi:hypothetical protein
VQTIIRSKTRILLVMAIVLTAVLLIACGGGAASDTTGGTTTGDEATQASDTGGGGQVNSVNFNNTSDKDMCSLYLSPVSEEKWGNDQLQGQQLAAGATFKLNNVPVGDYDWKATPCDGSDELTGQITVPVP